MAVILTGALTGWAQSAPKLSIIKIEKLKQGDWIKVDKGWSQTVPRLKVSIRAVENMKTSGLSVKAYFYDKDKKLIHRDNAPVAARHHDRGAIKDIVFEDELKCNKEWPLYFILSDDLETAKWQSVLIVVSDGQSTALRVFPGGKPEDFDFDEKSSVIKQ